MPIDITAAHGATIEIESGSPAAFSAIDGVFDGPNGPGWQPNIIEARHHGSTSIFRKVSNVDEQPVTFSLYYDSSDANHEALRDAAMQKLKTNFQMTLTDAGAETYTFGAYVRFNLTAPVDGFNTAAVELVIDGGIELGA
jgi:hypothetical protein